ncbi:MAG: DUF3800 domain-containing protein [Candidatus Acidiferrales bacterium]
MSLIIYLDESGDLGWNFNAPFRFGGSSRHLTISSVCVPPEKKHIPKRVIRDLYTKFGWNTSGEKKWSQMSDDERKEFAIAAKKMAVKHPDIYLKTITVKKQNVMAHIRVDSNKLYNYMIGLCLLELMAKHDAVTMVPDRRSLKVQSGNSLHDYLQVDLWFYRKVKTKLFTNPQDSKQCASIQFADMLAGLVLSHYEDGKGKNYMVLAPNIRQKCLYFP